MSRKQIVSSPRARKRLAEIADYLYEKKLLNEFVLDYLNRFEKFLDSVLRHFPKSGVPMREYGKDVRRVN